MWGQSGVSCSGRCKLAADCHCVGKGGRISQCSHRSPPVAQSMPRSYMMPTRGFFPRDRLCFVSTPGKIPPTSFHEHKEDYNRTEATAVRGRDVSVWGGRTSPPDARLGGVEGRRDQLNVAGRDMLHVIPRISNTRQMFLRECAVRTPAV